MRLQRGVNMCGIGKALAVAECEPVAECTPGDDDCEEEEGGQADGPSSGEYETYDEAASEDEE
jgi:hypothetical protein